MEATGYLSLTRGESAPNYTGLETGATLGAIHVQEMLAARTIDGGEQYFTRAFGVGPTRNAAEAYRLARPTAHLVYDGAREAAWQRWRGFWLRAAETGFCGLTSGCRRVAAGCGRLGAGCCAFATGLRRDVSGWLLLTFGLRHIAAGWRSLTSGFYCLAAGCCGLGAWIALDGTAK